MKLLCFGDSNTFGYDPRSVFGSQYGKEDRWTDILQAQTGHDVVNAGQNGREIPRRSFELDSAIQLISRHDPDLILVMLGTNDLLQGVDPETVAARMETFLKQLPEPVLLVAPPPLQRGTWVTDDDLVTRSRMLGQVYRDLSERLKIPFADSSEWGVDLTFDGVHFTEAGHHTFAAHLIQFL